MPISKDITIPFIINIFNCKLIKNRKSPIVGIYKITSPDGKIYIGQASDIENRLYHGYKNLLCKKQKLIYESIISHGLENHVFEVIHTISIYDKSELNKLEEYYINIFDTYESPHGLNQTKGGDHSGKHTELSKKKISDANKCKIVLPLTREKIRKSQTGRKHTEEHKKKNREARIGNKNHFYGKTHTNEIKKMLSELNKKNKGVNHPFYGKNHTQETKKILSELKKGTKKSEEEKLKQSIRVSGTGNPMYGSHRTGKDNPMFGKKHSPESLALMSKLKKGKKQNAETILKRVQKKIGTKDNEEVKKRKSEARKLYWENIRQERAIMIF